MKKHSGHMYSFDQLQGFVDGSLPERQAREIQAHIDSCAECRATADKLRSLEMLAAQSLENEAPDGYFNTFGSRVASRIAAKKMAPARGRFRLPLWGVIPLAAAAGLVLMIAIRTEPPAPHLAIQLPPATRTGSSAPVAPAAPVEQIGPAPAVTPMPASQRADRGEQKAGSPVSGEPSLAANSSAPATVSDDRDRAARIEEAAPQVVPAVKTAAEASSAGKKEQLAEPSVSDKPSLAASAAAPAETERAKKMTSPSPAAPAAPAGAIARMERDGPRPPARVKPAKNLQSQQPGGAPVQVIVIHLTDGGSFCRAPEIATAIEIRLPPGRATSN